jgi:hypothetical protein
MLNLIVAIVLAMAAGTGGVLYAADGALPGDRLYGIDQAMESVRLNLTSDPETAAELLLAFAGERLSEAEELSQKGDEKNLEDALNSYGETISSVAQTLATAEGVDKAALAALLDEAFSVHEERVGRIFENTGEDGDDGAEDDEPEEDECDHCVGVDPHPVGKSLAESYDDVSYEDIMTWFCDGGYGFGEIMLALETSEETDMSPEELLALKTELGGWGLVWQELGLIGPPTDTPVGPPEDKPGGPPDDAPAGPPDDAPAGPPDDAPAGPPDDAPAGPPDDAPAGPPDDAPAGPPDEAPAGPPDEAPAGPPDDAPAGPPDDTPVEPPEDKPGGRP